MVEWFHSAEVVRSSKGRQYHIGLRPGDVAPTILLCGDPGRAHKVARKFFDSVRLERSEREFVTFTGRYKGLPLSVMSTGIGPDNTEIAVIELCQIVRRPTLIRIGSSGALPGNVRLGDLVISTGAVRLENTSTFFVPEGYPAIAHHEVVGALLAAAEELGLRHHLGLTASAPGFYGAQARKVPGFSPRFPGLPKDLERLGVVNFEMETSALFILAQLARARSGAVCAVYASRSHNRFVNSAQKRDAEERCIRVGLRAAEILSQRPSQRR